MQIANDSLAHKIVRRSIRQNLRRAVVAIAGLVLIQPVAVVAQGKVDRAGYLCCNMQVYKDWISDINYQFEGTQLLRAGRWLQVTDEGRYYYTVKMGAKTRYLGNDYSRSVPGPTFLKRYIVRTDPRKKIESYDEFTQDAIRRLKVMPGMTKDQAAIAIGYPVGNYTPTLKSRTWEYWLDRSSSFKLHWNGSQRLSRVSGEWPTVRRVLYMPPTDVVMDAQVVMTDLQIDVGKPDGYYGRMTRDGILLFQKKEGLTENGVFDAETLSKLGLSLKKKDPE